MCGGVDVVHPGDSDEATMVIMTMGAMFLQGPLVPA
jgi:hypothetical protein